MKIRIHCDKCKEESLLMAEKVMKLSDAKNVVKNITEIIKRHESHPSYLDFYVFEREEDQDMQRYVIAALNDRIKKNVNRK